VPKECAKFANMIKNLIEGKVMQGESQETKQRLTLTVLSEFFATGLIENEHIYLQIILGRVTDVA
jgi:hypothetical protein